MTGRKQENVPLSRTIIACTLMILVALYVNFGVKSKSVPALRPLSTFPTKIGGWKGSVGRFDDKIYHILGVDDSFLCTYRADDNKYVQLYIGYYNEQREGELIHSPKNCMPGAGWDIINTSLIRLKVPGRGEEKVVKMILKKGKESQVMLYWFQSRGRIISSEYWQKIYLVWDSITKHRTDGAFIRLIAPVTLNETHTITYMKTFAQELFPILDQYLPGAELL